MEHIQEKLNRYRLTNNLSEPVRRKDKKTRYYIDNEFLADGYAAVFRKISLIDIYSVLAKYANYRKQECFPSIQTIIRESGVKNRNTVMKAIKKLEELKIIKVFSSKGRKSNRYVLLDTDIWVRIDRITGDMVQQYQSKNKVVHL